MDELGSALRHSDEPNFRVAPFLFMPEGNLESAVRLSCNFFFTFLSLILCICSLILLGICNSLVPSTEIKQSFHAKN